MRRIGSTPAERGSTGQNNCPDVIELSRLGSTPAERGSTTGATCPDVLEQFDGDFLVIGKVPPRFDADIRASLLRELGASVGEDEAVVIVPRDCILAAAKQLAAEGQI